MAIHGMSAEDKFAASSSEILNRFGVRLTMGYDFDEYRHWVKQARPDHVVGDPFDNKQHKLGKGNACWIIGRDETGKIMHTQALRILPTGLKSVGEYFRSSFRGFAPSRPDIDYDRSRYRPGPGAKRMSGRVAYSGETWVGGSPGQYRGSGLSTVLGRYALLSAIKEFNVDYVVGFMIKPVAYKGFCLRMGFMHAEPMALRWYIQNEDEPVEAVMVYMSNEDIRFILDLPAAELDALAA